MRLLLAKLVLFCGVFLGLLSNVGGQSLPDAMRISPDGKMLLTGKHAPDGLYDSATVRNIYLSFPQTNYWALLTANYTTHTDLPAQMTVDGVVYDSVGVRFKGQTSYMQVQNSQKKSFNISTNFVHDDQKLMGYQTMNLNNCFQDASFLREVFYLHQIRKHIPAAKATFVQLYINDQPWGLYPSVQQLNKDYLEEWFLSNDGANWRADRIAGNGPGGPGGGPGWGDGTAALNYLGADTALYQPHYILKSNDAVPDAWQHLVATCDALNNTSAAELPEVLPNYLDVDRTLWFLATEIAFSDDDSYVYKGRMDYYVYYEPETGRMTPLEYDGNSVMKNNAINWSPFYNATNANYPLLNRMLAVPIWRQRYLAHLRTIIDEELNPATTTPMIDNFKLMIDPLVQADPKKLYSYNQFVTEVNALKSFVTSRRTYLLSQAEVNATPPTISQVAYVNEQGQSWTAPTTGQSVQVTATVSSTDGIFGVNLFYATGLVGNFSNVRMLDDGLHNDGAAGDGVYGASIPGQETGQWVRFYVEAVSNNTARTVAYMPVGAEHDVYIYRVLGGTAGGGPLVINEVMAVNTSTVTDPNGAYEDWIELFNNSAGTIDLSGYFLSDKADNPTKYEIPQGVTIPAFSYLIFWADEDGVDGATHCNFKLSADGELVTLYSPALVLIDSVEFGPQQANVSYARSPNATGAFIFKAPTFAANNDLTATTDPAWAKTRISIGPNPANDLTQVTIEEPLADMPLLVRDINGRTIWQESMTHKATTIIATQGWPNGVYVVSYGPLAQKLIIQH